MSTPLADSTEPVHAAGTSSSRISPRLAAAALALFTLLAVFHTWPLASAPASLSRHDIADAMLNEWAVAWVAHQLPRDPLHLFDANIFYPERNTLAFSEHLFTQALMGAPLLWAGAPTLLVHNLLILAGFALTGWTMCLVMRQWTGDWWAGIVAGMLLAFNAHTLTRIAHLQAVHVEFLPLALFAFDRLLRIPRMRTALWLAAMFVLQSLTSNYLLVFMTFAMLAAAAARPFEWLGRNRRRVFVLLCGAAVVAVAMLVPFLLPYQQAQRNQGLTRSLTEVGTYAASWRDYLYTGGRLHYELWSAPFFRGSGAALFPGVAALLLTAVAIGSGAAWRRRDARLWLAVALSGLVLSFGTLVPGYTILYQVMPLLQGIRATVRFGFLVLAGIAALAGFGLAGLRLRFADRPRLRMAISIAAVTLVTIEAARIPVGYWPAHQTPAAYRILAEKPVNVVVELPLYAPTAFFRNGDYMLHSTVHWRPILNGYSGFMPASYALHHEALREFPDASALAYLRRLGVTHVAVHANAFAEVHGHQRLQQISTTPGLHVAVQGGANLTIYRLGSEEQ
jgi:hypothetical protein